MRAKLKQGLGQGAAHVDDSHGTDNLHDVLKALAQSGEPLTGRVATIATGVLAEMIADTASRLQTFNIRVAVAGTAGQTDVQLRVNGVAVATLTVLNTDADPTSKSSAIAVDVAAGDLIDLNVSAAPTAGTGLVATARLKPITVE